ncbi:MAG: hypothetical protein N2200_06650 [Bacteroidia bacterium]|nr:hypothetical protein [Bacteroidia bacterium]
MTKLLPLFPWIEIAIRWGVEMLLSFLVGSQISIGRIERLYIGIDGSWSVSLTQVRIQGTIPGDTFPIARLNKVSLHGKGKQIDTVAITGGEVTLIRLSKSNKNFRLFPKRSEAGASQNFVLRAQSLHFHLFNFPSKTFLNLVLDSLCGQVRIDSLSVQISHGSTGLHAKEICIHETKWVPSAPLSLHIEGIYHKLTDLWQKANLHLIAAEGQLNFSGDIERWEIPTGHIGGFIDSSLIQTLSGTGSDWIGSKNIYFCGETRQLQYELRLTGAWRMGQYDACIRGKKDTIHYLAAELTASPWSRLYLCGTPDGMCVSGVIAYQKLVASIKGSLDIISRRGSLILSRPEGDFVQATGTLSNITFTGSLGDIPLKGRWQPSHPLYIQIDTAEVGAIQRALAPYTPLLRGGGSLPVEVHANCIFWADYGSLHRVRFLSQNGKILISGTGQVKKLPVQPQVRISTTAGFSTGVIVLDSPEGYLHAEWRGDTAEISLTGRWEEVVGEINAQAFLTERRAYLRNAGIIFPTGDRLSLGGSLTMDSADVVAEGSAPLPWLLRYLPIHGLELHEGVMSIHFCASGEWDTLLQWANPSEGHVAIKDARGFFPTVGLPLHNFSAELSYSPKATVLHRLSTDIGSLSLRADGQVEGALSYLYTDWYRLKGELHIEAAHLVLSEVWRKVEQRRAQSRFRFPSQLNARISLSVKDVDFLGINIQSAHISGSIEETAAFVDTMMIFYKGAELTGRAALDMQDSSCYMVVGRLFVQRLPVDQFLRDMRVENIPTLQRLGIKGIFAGDMQVSLRFTPEIRWLHQSGLYATGSISAGRIKTPRFMRWLRPYYLNAYKDSLDFFARVSDLSVSNGFLRLPTALLLSRVAAFEVSGYHHFPTDRFLYRIQAMRVRRRVQRHPNLEALAAAFEELIDQSIGLIYVEKEGDKVVWRYPWRYLLKRLVALPKRPSQK